VIFEISFGRPDYDKTSMTYLYSISFVCPNNGHWTDMKHRDVLVFFSVLC